MFRTARAVRPTWWRLTVWCSACTSGAARAFWLHGSASRRPAHKPCSEILRAARNLARQAVAGEITPEQIDERRFESQLLTAGLPDPDLLIRTSGEQRISNFLLWQCAYAELVFLDTLWPDFGKEHLEQAIAEFRRRERRYGGVSG